MIACSQQSLAVDEPLGATAPAARAWIVIENTGPWGRNALADSPLPDAVREHLGGAKSLGITVLLARHPDRRVDALGINVWVARPAVGGMRLRHGVLPDLAPLARWDLEAIARGELPALDGSASAPLLLVCTHSKRDQCCAVNGRALAAGILEQATPAQRERVWECSHIGGHRFSPVTVSLPSGVVHGRLSVEDGLAVLTGMDEGRVVVERMRGRSCLPEPLQAADLAVRRSLGIDEIDALDVLLVANDRAVPVDMGWPVPTGAVDLEVRHRDGRAWRTRVQHMAGTEQRSESCGAEPLPVHSWVAAEPQPVSPWR